MTEHEFVENLKKECNKHAHCEDGCPFYYESDDPYLCNISRVARYNPTAVDSREPSTRQIEPTKMIPESIKVNTPDGFPKVEIYASVNFYDMKGQVSDECE